jgi:hypothetical protein
VTGLSHFINIHGSSFMHKCLLVVLLKALYYYHSCRKYLNLLQSIRTPPPSLKHSHPVCPSNDRGRCWTHAPPDAILVTQSGELERERAVAVGLGRHQLWSSQSVSPPVSHWSPGRKPLVFQSSGRHQAPGIHSSRLCPKWHPIPYIVNYF